MFTEGELVNYEHCRHRTGTMTKPEVIYLPAKFIKYHSEKSAVLEMKTPLGIRRRKVLLGKIFKRESA